MQDENDKKEITTQIIQEGSKESKKKTRKKTSEKGSKEKKEGLTDDEYDSLLKLNEDEELSFSSFSQNLAFALIAACWAIEPKAIGNSSKSLIVCLGFAIFYLGLKWIAHILNIKHYRTIIESERSESKKYSDFGIDETIYGKMSDIVFYLEIIVLAISAISFGYTCILVFGL